MVDGSMETKDEETKNKEIKDEETNSTLLKYFKTLCLSLGFLSLGLCVAVVGPALPTLAYNLQVTINTLAFLMLARAFGYLLGSIISGLVYEKIDSNLMMFFALSFTAIGTFLIPYVNVVLMTALAISAVGISMGFLDTAGNVVCLQTWGENSGPFLQTLHFSFAVGTTIVPLLAIPFIMDAQPTDISIDIHNGSIINFTTVSIQTTTNIPVATGTTPFSNFEKFTQVTYLFLICAVVTCLVGLSFLYLYCFHPGSFVSDQKNTVKEEGAYFRIKMLVLLFFFFLVYVGAEVCFGMYIYTFAINCEKKYSKSYASILNSLFWGSFALGRFLAIPISRYFSPSKVLLVNLCGTFTSALMLALFPFYAQSAEFLLWIAIAVYGLSMASIFPTGITWAEQYVTVTGKAAMVFVVGAATGEMLWPFIAGQFIEANPMYLMYFALGSACGSILNYVLLDFVARTKGKRLKKTVNVEIDEDEVNQGLTDTKLESLGV